MSDIRFTPTHHHDGVGTVRIDKPEYEDAGSGWLICGWCFAAVREIDATGHTGWHRALTDRLWGRR